jgi:hypothetical protein
MSAVDVPTYRGLGGRAAGDFAARPGARRLAGVAMRWVLIAGTVALAFAARRPADPAAVGVVVWALTLAAVAGVGLAVRRARVTIEPGGVRWGWRWLGVRIDRDRLRSVDVHADAVVLRPRRGSTWHLSARDWERFAALVAAVERAGLPVIRHVGRAPLGARLQSYGRVLDGLLVLTMLASTILVAVAASL